MTELTIPQAQLDMRNGYLCGAPGVFVSGAVWLAAGLVAVTVTHKAAVLALLIGGAAIHPLAVLVGKLLGRSGTHAAANPLGRLAIEGTIWLLAGIVVAYGMSVLRLEWFFPAMLLLIGGRYLMFQTLYGLRLYWVLGGVLCFLGVALALASTPVPVAAFAGGIVEILFAGLLIKGANRAA